MEHAQQCVKEAQRGVVGGLGHGLCLAVLVGWLHHLKIPAGELVPEESIDRHERVGDAILGEVGVHLGIGLAEFALKPARSDAARLVLLGVCRHLPALHQSEGVPYLVVEVASLLAERLVEEDVVARGRTQHHAHAHAVGAILLDELDGVGRIAEALRHLAAQFVAHDTREIDVLEGLVVAILIARHDHARHPEEDDIRTRHEVGGREIVVDLLVVGLVDAVEEGDRPQP